MLGIKFFSFSFENGKTLTYLIQLLYNNFEKLLFNIKISEEFSASSQDEVKEWIDFYPKTTMHGQKT